MRALQRPVQGGAERGNELRPVGHVLSAALIALGLDVASRAWAQDSLAPHDPVPLLGEVFRLRLGYNTGVAFGVFADGGRTVLVLTGVIIVGMLVLLVHALREGGLPGFAALPLGLILGGAVANFADRLSDGRVTDFLDLGIGTSRWPTFNLADAAITMVVAILTWNSFRDGTRIEAAR